MLMRGFARAPDGVHAVGVAIGTYAQQAASPWSQEPSSIRASAAKFDAVGSVLRNGTRAAEVTAIGNGYAQGGRGWGRGTEKGRGAGAGLGPKAQKSCSPAPSGSRDRRDGGGLEAAVQLRPARRGRVDLQRGDSRWYIRNAYKETPVKPQHRCARAADQPRRD